MLKSISILSFIFFLGEILARVFIYGLIKEKDAYLRRDYMNILNLILLIFELLYLTPLSKSATFHSFSKVRALRVMFLVQLVYQRSLKMKLIFQAFVRCLPFMFVLILGFMLTPIWIDVILVKLYKDDRYYCDNAHDIVSTKQQCFDWGGDWVRFDLNSSSVLTTLVIGILSWTM